MKIKISLAFSILLTLSVSALFLETVFAEADAKKELSASKEICIPLSDKPDIEIIRQVPPPTTKGYESSEFRPGTIYTTTMSQSITNNPEKYDFTKYDLYHFLWANRCNSCNPKNKGNGPELDIAGKTVRFYFTTVAKANSCTILQLRKILNHDKAAIRKDAAAAGLSIAYKKSEVQAKIKTSAKAWNICYLSHSNETELSSTNHLKGIVLDYEVQDKRTPSATASFVSSVNKVLGNRKFIFYSNAIVGQSAINNGINNVSGKRILEIADGVGILLHSAFLSDKDIPEAINSQLAVYGADRPSKYKKVYVTFEMNLSLARAVQVRNIIKSKGMMGVMEWRNGAKPGPTDNKCSFSDYDDFHKKMICLSYGICKES